ncbi:glycosyl transferase, partial [Halorubrum sp. GN11_10-6_MGM]|uniref:alpha-1,2-fucosyltransferase n=1 Tax=Halorubrum sp. GN11_10-6_MGM TaxID=2518112 RepID=UPI0011347972
VKEHDFVRHELLSMTKGKHKDGIQEVPRKSVCVHVRLGDDFEEPGPGEDLEDAGHNTKLPLSWYKKKLSQVRSVIGESVPAYIFSDVDNDRLRPILNAPNTIRAYFGSSIADMLALSQAGVLIASGSTFSMWASYLGRMPVIWYPGQLRQRLY